MTAISAPTVDMLPNMRNVERELGRRRCRQHRTTQAARTRPFTWSEIEAKFDKLAAGNATEKSRQKIKNAVRSLENIQVSDLMKVAWGVAGPHCDLAGRRPVSTGEQGMATFRYGGITPLDEPA